MPNISHLSTAQLKRVIAIREKIEALEAELDLLTANADAVKVPGKRGRKKGLRSIVAEENPIEEPSKKRRKFSRATKEKMAAAQKARWEKIRAEKAAA